MKSVIISKEQLYS